MAIPVTADYIIEKNKSGQFGYEPVVLVEILGVGIYMATRDPGFSEQAKFGQGFIVGGQLLFGGDIPTYETILQQLRNGGVSSVVQEIADDGLALTGGTGVDVLNEDYFSHIVSTVNIQNAPLRIKLGFAGQTYDDFAPMFLGNVDSFNANIESFFLDVVDDTVRMDVPVPPIIGDDFLPRAFTVGGAIPIVLGDQTKVPVIQTVGDVDGTLALELNAGGDEVFLYETTAPFPDTGEITITSTTGVEVMTYTTVEVQGVIGLSFLVLGGLTRGAPVTHPSGARVELTSVVYRYLQSFEGIEVPRRVRLPDGVHPTAHALDRKSIPVVGDGSDPRKLTVYDTTTELADPITATVAGEGRAINLISNGDGGSNPDPNGWTIVGGAWDSFTPAGYSEPLIRGRVLAAQGVQSELIQDVPTTPGKRYRLAVTMENVDAPFMTVRVGTTTVPAAYYDFGQYLDTVEQGFDVTFVATALEARVTLVVDNTGVGGGEFWAYFDHVHLYDLTSENPANMIQTLVQNHFKNIKIDTDSFATAETLWEEVGDRMAGVIQEAEEQQGLLGRIATQFRATTFLGENGKQKIKVFDNAEAPIARHNSTHTSKGSVIHTQSGMEEIYTRFFVYFNRDPSAGAATENADLGGRDSFLGVVFATPEGTNNSQDEALQQVCQTARDTFKVDRKLEIFADMIPDVATAERLCSLITRWGTHRRDIYDYTTFLNATDLEVMDVIKFDHPLVPVSKRGRTYLVKRKEFQPNGMLTHLKIEEINQAAFGSFLERWEPPLFYTPSVIIVEDWEPTPPPDLTAGLLDGSCLPWIESWEPVALAYREEFNQYLDGNDLTRAIQWGQDWSYVGGIFTVGINFSKFSAFGTVHIEEPPTNLNTFLGTTNAPGNFNAGNLTIDELSDRVILNDLGGTIPSLPFIRVNREDVAVGPQIDMDEFFTFSTWVNLSSKPTTTSMGLWDGASQAGGSSIDHTLMLWWNRPTDRFIFALAETVADCEDGQTTLDSITNRVVASSFGAPSIGSWAHIVCRWNPGTSTISIQVNDGAVNSAVITPDFTGLQQVTLHGNMEFIDAAFGLTDVRRYMHLDGKTTASFYWQRDLTSGENTQLYNSGSGVTWPTFT